MVVLHTALVSEAVMDQVKESEQQRWFHRVGFINVPAVVHSIAKEAVQIEEIATPKLAIVL